MGAARRAPGCDGAVLRVPAGLLPLFPASAVGEAFGRNTVMPVRDWLLTPFDAVCLLAAAMAARTPANACSDVLAGAASDRAASASPSAWCGTPLLLAPSARPACITATSAKGDDRFAATATSPLLFPPAMSKWSAAKGAPLSPLPRWLSCSSLIRSSLHGPPSSWPSCALSWPDMPIRHAPLAFSAPPCVPPAAPPPPTPGPARHATSSAAAPPSAFPSCAAAWLGPSAGIDISVLAALLSFGPAVSFGAHPAAAAAPPGSASVAPCAACSPSCFSEPASVTPLVASGEAPMSVVARTRLLRQMCCHSVETSLRRIGLMR
eukprot:140449-Chlamydomonas_euryale.AAC.6